MPLTPHLPAADAAVHADLVVALDAGDLAGADRERAEALVAACAGCAELLADLAAIRHAVAVSPAPARRRDYRLAPEDAARLQPNGWRRLVGWLAAPRSSVRPLATGLATLGIVGLLLTSGLPGAFGGPAVLSTIGAPVTDRAGAQEYAPSGDDEVFGASTAPAAAPTMAPAPQAVASEPPAAEGLATEVPGGVSAGSAPSAEPEGDRNAATAGEPEAGKNALADAGIPAPVLLSLALLVAGVGLLVARLIARRRLA